MVRSVMALPQFLQSAEALPKESRSKLVKTLKYLSEDVRHPSLQTKRVKGNSHSVYECRLDQGLRLVYDEWAGMLRCWYVGEHDEALRYAAHLDSSGRDVIVEDIPPATVDSGLGLIEDFLENGICPSDFLHVNLDALA